MLPNGHVVDDWYPLIVVGAQGRGEMGSLRVRAQFLQETLMPLEEYKALKDVSVPCDRCQITPICLYSHSTRLLLSAAKSIFVSPERSSERDYVITDSVRSM